MGEIDQHSYLAIIKLFRNNCPVWMLFWNKSDFIVARLLCFVSEVIILG